MRKIRIAAVLLALFLCLGAVPIYATPGKIELKEGEEASLTVLLNDPVSDEPLSGVACYIWLVAKVSGEGMSVHFDATGTEFETIFTEQFASRVMDSTEAWDDLARYVDQNAVPATNAVYSDSTGKAVFTEYADGQKLVPGLYLVRCADKQYTYTSIRNSVGGYFMDTLTRTYSFQRCVVMIPGGYFTMGNYHPDAKYGNGWYTYDTTMKEDWEWDYNVVTRPKIKVVDWKDTIFIPSPPPPPPETEPETEPPETEPFETEPPETEPPETEPPETEAETEPPETEPPETEAPETEPPETEPPETIPLIYPPEEIPEEPEEPWIPPVEIPEEPIPQTGLLWWPVPVMGVGGLACVGIGSLVARKSGKDDDDNGDDEA